MNMMLNNISSLPPGADSAGLFHRKRIIIMIVIAIIGIVISTLANVFSEDRKTSAPDATIASESALGHKAFVSMIQRLDMGSDISFNPLEALMGGVSMPIFLEPNPAEIAPVDFSQRFKGDAVFIVLPKWAAIADAKRPRWITQAQPMQRAAVQEMARAIASDIIITRNNSVVPFVSTRFKVSPVLTRPQLMQSAKITPLISSSNGILFGQVKRGKTMVYVLSDPDLLNNHGLDNGQNSILAVRMLDLARGKASVSFDSTVQKFSGSISLWRQLFLPPLLGLLVLTLAAIAGLIWHVLVRLSPPQIFESGLAAGKQGLIDNSAALFDSGEHDVFLKTRYLEAAISDITVVLPMIGRNPLAQRSTLLDDIGVRRGVSEHFSDLWNMAHAADISLERAAKRIDIWKQEIIRGLN
jgi:hypothetical protein